MDIFDKGQLPIRNTFSIYSHPLQRLDEDDKHNGLSIIVVSQTFSVPEENECTNLVVEPQEEN